MGGQHLNWVAPSAIVSGVEGQVVGQVSTLTATPSQALASMGSASEDDRCSTCTRPPVQRALSMTWATAVLGPAGPGPEEVGVALAVGRRRPRHRLGVLGVDQEQRREAGQHLQVLVELGRAQVGGTRRPRSGAGSTAEHAGVVQAAQLADVPGDGAAQKPTSTWTWPSAALRLTSRAATSTVGGSS